ncbi:hypothetical protein GGS23DRAFT_574075 [Durotheca rogersii]|uniref:uncharacterized protein n=1 Tax=Durotheca rogersii TaxID=419775 RepID=UPI0022203B0F|nr:uncharacterized protein GGS23DRAFT_574075 [Durotheca rogersii]KAI5861998.1 hypothetical protein GGS23DRAFT_574075 [Durotheca rogersii]
MSTVEDLQRQLRELQELRNRDNERLRREKEEAEARAAGAEARAAGAEAQAEQALRQTRKTTLEEYLQACHEHVLTKITLVTDGYLTSRVPTTNPTKKHCPCLLKPWDDFLDKQIDMLQRMACTLPSDKRLFENIASLKAIGERAHARQVTSESSLVFIENNCVEDPVRIILSELKNFQSSQLGFFIHDGVFFETTASNLRDESDGRDAAAERDSKLRTDQICVFRDASGQREIAYVIEYKAPHKLHTTHLEQGLRKMRIAYEVVNKPTIPTTEPDKFKHYAELLSTAAVTQTYHYMLEAGLEYGYLTNGEAIVFLKIDWADPTVLFFHLAQPSREVVVDEDPIYSNAVSQVLAFTLLALQGSPHGNDERTAATSKCDKWEVDFSYILDKVIQNEEREAQEAGPKTPQAKKHRRTPSSPEWLPKPIKKTKRNPKLQLERERDGHFPSYHRRGGHDGGPGGEGPGGLNQGSGAASGSISQSGASQAPSGDSASTPSAQSGSGGRDEKGGRSRQNMPYCTTDCLLSLVHGWAPDMKCPNIQLHMRKGVTDKKRHPVSYTDWMSLLQQQLSQSLEKGVRKLGQEGSCGALFQLTLLQYGYTFVAKGATGRCAPMLQQEEAVYRKLQPLQGRHIPVCLGSIDLHRLGQVLYYYFDVRIVYFLLLSYGGSKLRVPSDSKAQACIIKHVATILKQMHRLGVAHADIRLPNVLQDPAGHVVIVDFDQASISPEVARRARIALSPNKRRRLMEEAVSAEKEHQFKVQMDMANVRSLFTLDIGRIIQPQVEERDVNRV